MASTAEQPVRIPASRTTLDGILDVPAHATGMVVFAHGSGSGRLSPRNQYVAGVLRDAGLGTLLFDLLTPEEENVDATTAHLRFDVRFLAERLVAGAAWVADVPGARGLPVGYFGASTGAAAALIAAAAYPDAVRAVVSRGGRPDLAGPVLEQVRAPTLLIVGGDDGPVIEMNRRAFDALGTEKNLVIVPGATHLFEEPGALERVAALASDWFLRWLPAGADARPAPR
jgi:putative phosphoribosyl transferase